MIIDFHTHMFPDKIAHSTISLLSKNAGIKAHTDGTLDDTVNKFKEANVTYAVVCNIATNPKQMHNVNSFAIDQKKCDMLIPFGSIHPEGDYLSELDRLKDNGIKGIKLHPEYQQFYIDDKNMSKIYEEILKRNFVLIFHTGIDYGMPPPLHATPKMIKNVLGMFSGEKVVLAHMGGFGMWDDVSKYILGNDIYIDTSCIHAFEDKNLVLKLIGEHKKDKILFATDTPWNDIKSEIKSTYNLGLDEEFTNMILYDNAKKLLEI